MQVLRQLVTQFSSRMKNSTRSTREKYFNEESLRASSLRIQDLSPTQLKMSIHATGFLAIFFAFKDLGHIFWETPKPVIILTDNKSVTCFFQINIFPPTLWNACVDVIEFNFTFVHIPGKSKTAEDYLSRLEISPKEKLILRIREDIPTTPIELHVQSAGVSGKEQYFYTENDDETEDQIRKSGNAKNKPEPIPAIKYQTPRLRKLVLTTITITNTHFARNSNTSTVAIEETNDVILQQLRLKILREEHSETILLQYTRYTNYLRQLDRVHSG